MEEEEEEWVEKTGKRKEGKIGVGGSLGVREAYKLA